MSYEEGDEAQTRENASNVSSRLILIFFFLKHLYIYIEVLRSIKKNNVTVSILEIKKNLLCGVRSYSGESASS